LRLQGAFTIAPDPPLRGEFQLFTLELNQYDGALLNGRLALDHYYHERIGIGAGWSYYDYDQEIDDTHRAT